MILVTATKVRRWTSRRTFGGGQELVREYRVMGFKVWTTVLERPGLGRDSKGDAGLYRLALEVRRVH